MMETLLARPTVQEIDLAPLNDAEKVCDNPHKGWYLHYYDNALTKYGAALKPHDRLLDFPGLATLYLRLPWCELEPREGEFAWRVLDEVIDRWLPTGRTIAFCVSCKETNPRYVFATPAWVRDAGAQGRFIPRADGSAGNWEPDYGDPVFLAKLEAFHRAFAARYDGRPWVEWITIGSYGDWGEGHTCSSSHQEWPVEVIARHLDIYRECYPLSRLEANDDLVGSRKDRASAEKIRRLVDERGFSLTDHGVSVDWFARHYGPSTLRDAAWLRSSAERAPVVLELEHYHLTVKHSNWKGGEPLRLAVEEAAATFAGFHGCARTWLADNPAYARDLANRLGYWLFPRRCAFTPERRAGDELEFRLVWENRGVAPLYLPADLILRLQSIDDGPALSFTLGTVDRTNTRPGRTGELVAALPLPADLPKGRYALSYALIDQKLARPIQFAVAESAISADGFHAVPGQTLTISR